MSEDARKSRIKVWSARGITLATDDDDSFDAAELVEFALRARSEFPDAKIQLAGFELRVVEYPAMGTGPYLDWRD